MLLFKRFCEFFWGVILIVALNIIFAFPVSAAEQTIYEDDFYFNNFFQNNSSVVGTSETVAFNGEHVISLNNIDFNEIGKKFDIVVSGNLSEPRYGGVGSSYSVLADNSRYYISANGVKKYIIPGQAFSVTFSGLSSISTLSISADFLADLTYKSSMCVFVVGCDVTSLSVQIIGSEDESVLPDYDEYPDFDYGEENKNNMNNFSLLMNLIIRFVQLKFNIYGYSFSYWQVLIVLCLASVIGVFLKRVFSD